MTNCIKHKAVERIWLVPMAEDGELGYVWCDDPAPGAGMDPSEAVEYVRRDAHDARIAELEQERDALAAHAEVGKALVRDLLIDDITDDATRLTEWCALDSPATSVAKRDLLKQAELLERLARGPAQA